MTALCLLPHLSLGGSPALRSNGTRQKSVVCSASPSAGASGSGRPWPIRLFQQQASQPKRRGPGQAIKPAQQQESEHRLQNVIVRQLDSGNLLVLMDPARRRLVYVYGYDASQVMGLNQVPRLLSATEAKQLNFYGYTDEQAKVLFRELSRDRGRWVCRLDGDGHSEGEASPELDVLSKDQPDVLMSRQRIPNQNGETYMRWLRRSTSRRAGNRHAQVQPLKFEAFLDMYYAHLRGALPVSEDILVIRNADTADEGGDSEDPEMDTSQYNLDMQFGNGPNDWLVRLRVNINDDDDSGSGTASPSGQEPLSKTRQHLEACYSGPYANAIARMEELWRQDASNPEAQDWRMQSTTGFAKLSDPDGGLPLPSLIRPTRSSPAGSPAQQQQQQQQQQQAPGNIMQTSATSSAESSDIVEQQERERLDSNSTASTSSSGSNQPAGPLGPRAVDVPSTKASGSGSGASAPGSAGRARQLRNRMPHRQQQGLPLASGSIAPLPQDLDVPMLPSVGAPLTEPLSQPGSAPLSLQGPDSAGPTQPAANSNSAGNNAGAQPQGQQQPQQPASGAGVGASPAGGTPASPQAPPFLINVGGSFLGLNREPLSGVGSANASPIIPRGVSGSAATTGSGAGSGGLPWRSAAAASFLGGGAGSGADGDGSGASTNPSSASPPAAVFQQIADMLIGGHATPEDVARLAEAVQQAEALEREASLRGNSSRWLQGRKPPARKRRLRIPDTVIAFARTLTTAAAGKTGEGAANANGNAPGVVGRGSSGSGTGRSAAAAARGARGVSRAAAAAASGVRSVRTLAAANGRAASRAAAAAAAAGRGAAAASAPQQQQVLDLAGVDASLAKALVQRLKQRSQRRFHYGRDAVLLVPPALLRPLAAAWLAEERRLLHPSLREALEAQEGMQEGSSSSGSYDEDDE